MKIVHLCTLDSGGAAASALRLHQGLANYGVESRMLVLKSKGQHPGVQLVPMRRVRKDDPWQVISSRWERMLRRCPNRPDGLELFSGPRADVDLLSHATILSADVINLHWVAGLVDIPTLPILAKDRPVVWTLHDMNPLTGGCHFSGGCRRFEHGCGACPQLGSTNKADISAAYYAEKAKAYAASDFTVVSPSRWLADQARSSSCMSGKTVLTIPYGLDHTVFAPQPALPIRRLLQLEAEDFVILFGADYACVRKGGDAAFQLLSSLPQSMHGRRVVLATFGAPQPGLAKTGLKHLDLGYLNSPQLMAQVYAMADVLLMPTLEDNLPNTVLESMGCGTPVVGFATGGMPDMVEHGDNGWLAEPHDIGGLRRGIENVLITGSQTREAARQTILRRFTLSHQAQAYLRVYADLLTTNRALQFAIDVRTGQPIPESAHAHSWLDGMSGIEIGPVAHNSFGLDTINVGLYHPGHDKEQLQRTGSIAPLNIESPAGCLPLPSETENFILHSHVLEHCPDLIRAMLEWYRVLKPQGLLYMIVPKRDAAPSDRGKPLSTWKHFLQDFTNRQTHEKEPNAGAFGYCHYHVFSNRTLQGVVRQIFGDRMELCDMLKTDDKAGNGFTLVYRKIKTLQETFPWVIGDHSARHHLQLQNCNGREVIDVEQPRQQEPAPRMPATSRNPAMTDLRNDVIATVAAPIVDACRQAQITLKQPLLLAVAAFPATNPSSLSRQQACLSSLAALRNTGLHTVIPCLKQEKEALNDLFPEIPSESLLCNSADVRLNVHGVPKPFINEYFDAACTIAEREGYEWFGFANSDVLFTPLLIAHLKRCMHQNLQSVVVSRTELPGLDADGRPIAGYLEFAGYDAFFCRVDWWREHRHLFAPYIIGERAWDDAYASIMLTNARCELLWEQGALWHPEHERRWDLDNTVYGDWNMNLYSGQDHDYARRFEAFIEDVIAAGTNPLPEGENRTRLLQRNFTEAAVVQGDPKRFVNIVMVTYNRLSFTRQAIGSILRTADWPHRLTVVDNGSSDSTQDYLKELKRKGLIDTLILNEANLGVAKAANQGWLAEPDAAFMLKYDNDIVMYRTKWLSEMVHTADLLQGLGAVAYNFEPRSYPVTAQSGVRIRLKLSGNLGGACILIPMRTHEHLGFWTEDFGLYGEEDADYCHRIITAGWLLGYMDDENAGFHLPAGKAALIDNETYVASDGREEILHTQYRQFKDEQRRQNIGRRNELFRQYTATPSTLRKDTSMRQCMQTFKIATSDMQNNSKQIHESSTTHLEYPLGKTDQLCPICVISFHISGTRNSSQFLRQLAPLQGLEKTGHVRIIDGQTLLRRNGSSYSLDTTTLPQDTIVFLQRDFSAYEFLFETGLPLIYDLDDNLLELPAEHPDLQQYQRLSELLKTYLHRFTAVMVPTENLRRLCAPYNPNTRVIPNFIPLVPARATEAGRKIRILLSGTRSHLKDAEFLIPVIEDICSRYPDTVEFIFWGYCPDSLRNCRHIHVRDTFLEDYPSYLQELASMQADIGLIPLNFTWFNSFKSDIKWKEYAVCGMVSIASDTVPYQSIRHGEDGYLADNAPQIWRDLLISLIEDAGLRQRVSETARNRVHAEFLLPNNLQLLHEALRNLPTRMPRTEQPEVSIIIPVFNKKELTRNCLETLLSIPSRHPYEVIVVDNASTDGTDELLRNHFSTCRTLANPDNMGFATACNQGATTARGEYLVFLNNDTVPLYGWLDQLVEAQLRHPDAGIVGCKLLYPDKTIQHCGASMNHDGSSFRHQYKFLQADHPLVNAERELDAVTAACCITSRTLFYKLGMFDTGYSNGCEDMDYCSKVRQAGFRIFYTPDSVLYHLESQTQRPKNRDRENFERYLSKWSSGFMKNEIEIYAEDGFWTEGSTNYYHSENIWLSEFSSSLKKAISTKDALNIFRYKNIIDRIYPEQTWSSLNKYNKISSITHRLNILFVCHNFPPYNTAGAQLFALEIARHLKRNGHDITFLYPVDISNRKEGDNKNQYDLITGKYKEFRVFQINTVDIDTNFMTTPQYMFSNDKVEERFVELLKREKFHLVHFHLLYRLSARLPLIAKNMGIPTVATLHDYWLLCAMGHLIDSLGRECTGPESPEKCARCLLGFNGEPTTGLIDFFALRQKTTLAGYNATDRIFSPSRHLAEVHSRFGFPKPEILPLGWPEVETASTTRNQSDKIIFGFIGQIVYRKGLDLLVHAFLALDPESQRRCELHIHGSVNQQHYFDALMGKVRDNPSVKFFGPYKHEELEKILATFDVTVIPSRQENYPLTVLESLSAKVPVIASDVGGIKEMFQDKVEGFLFKREDVSRLTKIFRMLTAEPSLLDTMRTKIRPIKSINRNAEEYADIYRTLIQEGDTTTPSRHQSC